MAIEVEVIAGRTKVDSSVIVSGSIDHPITNEELVLLGIKGNDCLIAVEKYLGRKPNVAYTGRSTPWGDVYRQHGWPEVMTRLRVQKARVLGFTSTAPTAVDFTDYENNFDERAQFHADLHHAEEESLETNWSENYGFEIGQSINYGVEFSGANIGGETSLSTSSDFGKGGAVTKAVNLGTSKGVNFELDPGEKARAAFIVRRGALKVEIVYRVSFTGDIFVNYNPTYKDHHFWGLPINAVLKASGLRRTFDITETILVGYVTEGRVSLTKI